MNVLLGKITLLEKLILCFLPADKESLIRRIRKGNPNITQAEAEEALDNLRRAGLVRLDVGMYHEIKP